jgi:dCTP diphosphatase
MPSFAELADSIAHFAEERDWEKFHSPKNLVMALSVETGELLEHFQWLTEEESSNLSTEKLEQVSKEIADVQIYLIRLADRLGVDVLAASASKLDENKIKYPADRVRGSAKKYSDYDDIPSGQS